MYNLVIGTAYVHNIHIGEKSETWTPLWFFLHNFLQRWFKNLFSCYSTKALICVIFLNFESISLMKRTGFIMKTETREKGSSLPSCGRLDPPMWETWSRGNKWLIDIKNRLIYAYVHAYTWFTKRWYKKVFKVPNFFEKPPN